MSKSDQDQPPDPLATLAASLASKSIPQAPAPGSVAAAVGEYIAATPRPWGLQRDPGPSVGIVLPPPQPPVEQPTIEQLCKAYGQKLEGVAAATFGLRPTDGFSYQRKKGS